MASGYPNSHQWNVVTTTPTLSSIYPNINRWAIGFDPLFETFKTVSAESKRDSYPPYNLLIDGNQHVLELAVAGFTREEISVKVQERTLTIEGVKEATEGEYVHKGIATRDFHQTFALAEYVVIKGATMKDGFLTVTLEQELPEEKQAKIITIA
jgi:molecular chaperone IbpA